MGIDFSMSVMDSKWVSYYESKFDSGIKVVRMWVNGLLEWLGILG